MATLLKQVGLLATRTAPATVESDDVYPVHLLDAAKTLRELVLTWTLQFNDILDAAKLHRSLKALLEIGDWRKIGGRLRLKENGGLEIHVPRPFTQDRPSVFYTHQNIPTKIGDHPLASKLPKPTVNPSVQASPDGFREFATRKDAPAVLEDFTNSDLPQLSLHITSFTDATLVGLSWPHTLMDVMGQQALLKGWAMVLVDRLAEVPPCLGARDDAVFAAADASSHNIEEFALKSQQLTGWSMAKFGARFAWSMLWDETPHTRMIFLPAAAVDNLQQQAQNDLAAQTGAGRAPFLSPGDLLTAWLARNVALSFPQPRPITVLHPLNARFRLPSLLNAEGVYVQNMVIAAFAFLGPSLLAGPLGPVALKNRTDLLDQAREPQVLAFLRELKQSSKAGAGDPSVILCGPSDALLMPVTNWLRGHIFDTVDFGAAVIQQGQSQHSRTNPPGTIVYHHASTMRQSATIRNVAAVLGKDHEGNYWLSGTLSPLAWTKIEESLPALMVTSEDVE